jgi:hypothetical protein
VVVVSQAFVRKEHPMKELMIFLARKAKNPDSIVIIPVFVGLTVEECYDPMVSLYNKDWPKGIEEPSKEDKVKFFKDWTAAVKQLPYITILRDEQVGAACSRQCGGEGTCRGVKWRMKAAGTPSCWQRQGITARAFCLPQRPQLAP